MTETVWLLWDHGDLRAAYSSRADAEADAAALRVQAMADLGRPPTGIHVESYRLRHARQFGDDGSSAGG